MVASILATTPEKIIAQGGAFVGTPDDVVAAGAELHRRRSAPIEPSMQINFGGSSDEEAFRTLELLAAKVFPRFRRTGIRGQGNNSLRQYGARVGTGIVALTPNSDLPSDFSMTGRVALERDALQVERQAAQAAELLAAAGAAGAAVDELRQHRARARARAAIFALPR